MTFKVKRKRYKEPDDPVDYWFQESIPDVVGKTNPAHMTSRALGSEPKDIKKKRKEYK